MWVYDSICVGWASLFALWSYAHANIIAIHNGREKERIIFNNKRSERMVYMFVINVG